MQDLLNRLKCYRTKLSKPALDNSFIKDLKFDDVTNEIPAGVVDGQELILKGAGNGYSDFIIRVIIK